MINGCRMCGQLVRKGSQRAIPALCSEGSCLSNIGVLTKEGAIREFPNDPF